MDNRDILNFDISEDGFNELFKKLGIEDTAPEPAQQEQPAAEEEIPTPAEELPAAEVEIPAPAEELPAVERENPASAEPQPTEQEEDFLFPVAPRPAAEAAPAEQQQEQKPRRTETKEDQMPWQKSLVLYMHDIVLLFSAVIVIFLLFFRVVVVSGTSMNNTLYDGDFLLLISNAFYKEPKAGDVIVASKKTFDNGAPIVKRVIATEGQIVDIDFERGIVYVDNVALEEPYIKNLTTMYEGVNFPLLVEEGCIFVLGDNRGDSKDSRSPEIGLIDTRQVVGKVIFLFLPGTNRGHEKFDLGRIGVVS